MDIDREIQNVKKLIATAEGETLSLLVDRLQALLRRKQLKDKPENTMINQQKQIQNQ
jgi:hypothetical protein